MSSGILVRFATLKDLFATFPTAETESGLDASDDPTIDAIRKSASGEDYRAAISLCAYLLSKREAVWWACGCLRQSSQLSPGDMRALEIAENWVRTPEESERRAALELGMQSSSKLPTTWIALAAGWSGGSLSDNDTHRVPPAPQLTAQAVRGALLMAPGKISGSSPNQGLASWVEAAIRLLTSRS